MVVVEVLTMQYWKHLSQILFIDGSSSHCSQVHSEDAFWMSSRITIDFQELRRHPHTKLFAHTYTYDK
jgi:hypothetical protein